MILLKVFVLAIMLLRLDKTELSMQVILIQDTILFWETDTSIMAVPEKAELVSISYYDTLFACCYLQPSYADITYFLV